MANITIRKVSISRFFEFATGVLPFDLIDIISEGETYGVHTAASSDEFEYQTQFFINERAAEDLGVVGMRVEMFVTDPQERKPLSSDAVASFEIKLDTITDMSPKKVLIVADPSTKSSNRLNIPGSQRQTTPTFSAVSKNLKTNGVDPAVMAATGNFFATTPKNAISLDGNNNNPGKQLNTNTLGSTIRSRSSLMAARSTNRSKRRGDQSNELVQTIAPPTVTAKIANVDLVSLLPKKKQFTQNCCIKKDRISGAEKLYAVVTAIAGKQAKTLFDAKIIEIQHGKQLTEFLANPEPPELGLVSSTPGRVKIRIQRTDKSLKTVRVIRIISNPNVSM